MNDDAKQELFRLGVMLLAIAAEWYAMQPYQEPVLARMWLCLYRVFQFLGRLFGGWGLKAEHRYYICVEAGLLWK
jgi:hypothetical protein